MTDEAKLVEELARIIDPSSWAVMDGYLKDMLRKYKGENAAYDPDAFKHKASMATARAVLASPTFTRLIAERDGAYADKYASFTDGMEAAAEICGSLAETTYDDADAFEAATGCEASIMGIVKAQRKEQAAIRNLNRSADDA